MSILSFVGELYSFPPSQLYLIKTIVLAVPRIGCHYGAHIIAWFAAFASPANALLFLIRANAVFRNHLKWRVFLFILWISTLSAFTAPFSFTASSFKIDGYCSVAEVDRIVVAGLATIAIFDTVVFFSVTREIVSTNTIMGNRGWRTLFTKGTGRVSQVLLLTGQLYYL